MGDKTDRLNAPGNTSATEMNFNDLEAIFPGRLERPIHAADIPSGIYFVYILAIDGRPIVVGHGKKNRAKVIFDSGDLITASHIKAMIVRLYMLFGSADAAFSRFLIRCGSKDEAKRSETEIHRRFGGNSLNIPADIEDRLFDGIEKHSPVWMALKMALCSSFDGLSDLRKWRREGILGDEAWDAVVERLKLK